MIHRRNCIVLDFPSVFASIELLLGVRRAFGDGKCATQSSSRTHSGTGWSSIYCDGGYQEQKLLHDVHDVAVCLSVFEAEATGGNECKTYMLEERKYGRCVSDKDTRSYNSIVLSLGERRSIYIVR